MKKAKTFKLSSQSLEALSHIVAATGITETAIIEHLLIDEAMWLGWLPPTERKPAEVK